MLYSHLIFALVTIVGFVASEMKIPDFMPPTTVKSFQIAPYEGRWYQMYASLIPNVTFERNGYCITGDYSRNTSSESYDTNSTMKFNVVNSERLGNATGVLKQMRALAVNDRFEQTPGKFVLVREGKDNDTDATDTFGSNCDGGCGMDKLGHYWIIALGEIEPENNLYPWAVISNPLGMMLFILARDVDKFAEEYEEGVLKLVKNKGFIFPHNKPIKTFQSKTECEYAPQPSGGVEF